jgi:predicted Abi (CAAX) family protease
MLAYLLAGSIWPSVAMHWAIVVAWAFGSADGLWLLGRSEFLHRSSKAFATTLAESNRSC